MAGRKSCLLSGTCLVMAGSQRRGPLTHSSPEEVEGGLLSVLYQQESMSNVQNKNLAVFGVKVRLGVVFGGGCV